jgi:hypothetical protein
MAAAYAKSRDVDQRYREPLMILTALTAAASMRDEISVSYMLMNRISRNCRPIPLLLEKTLLEAYEAPIALLRHLVLTLPLVRDHVFPARVTYEHRILSTSILHPLQTHLPRSSTFRCTSRLSPNVYEDTTQKERRVLSQDIFRSLCLESWHPTASVTARQAIPETPQD